ncbi:hypothetical protein K1719_029538 [Acacia pycnantha]|nr:hypothetical protein K1719_029538 [Acacia pycnantha]
MSHVTGMAIGVLIKFSSFLLLCFLLFFSSKSEARPFIILRLDHGVNDNSYEGNVFEDLNLGAVKLSGPSPGQGNEFTDSTSHGRRLMDNGPSPGQGHH